MACCSGDSHLNPDSPLCRCGSIENAKRFFFRRSFYQAQRNEQLRNVVQYQTSSLPLLLFGDLALPQDTNIAIFYHVHKFILATNGSNTLTKSVFFKISN